MTSDTDFDVLIIGAGISGIGIAYHLRAKCPDKSYAILEGRDRIGGTWDLFRYPGIRSDSDIYTLGFSFKPWRRDDAIVDGPSIRDYVEEAAVENAIAPHIRFGIQVTRANWSAATARWTVETIDKQSGQARRFTARFLAMGTGYYSYEGGYAPDFDGQADYRGQLIHPQAWPEDLDYAGKSVIVIGSGATAMTIVPSMAEAARHVTLLQRSPTYVVSRPAKDPVVNVLRRFLPARWVHALARRKNIWLQQHFFNKARSRPDTVRKRLLDMARKSVGEAYVADHFTPRYAPWDQRLCLIPDNDLFKTIVDGKVSVVTDVIERFTSTGVRLTSGKSLDADIIVTATGLALEHLGGIEVALDDAPVDFGQTVTYKGLAYSGVPNLVSSFGYFNASWTMRVELTADYICRLINHMDASGTAVCTPTPGPAREASSRDGAGARRPWIEGFSSGYIKRYIHLFPQQGAAAPWVNTQSFNADLKLIAKAPVDDGVMRFSNPPAAQAEAADVGGLQTAIAS